MLYYSLLTLLCSGHVVRIFGPLSFPWNPEHFLTRKLLHSIEMVDCVSIFLPGWEL